MAVSLIGALLMNWAEAPVAFGEVAVGAEYLELRLVKSGASGL
jgi:hypothetical protein